MAYQIDFDEDARSIFRHLSPLRKHKIKQCLREISQDPLVGKALQENLIGLYSYRAGFSRIIYKIEKEKSIVNVVAIAHRKSVYEEVGKLLRIKKPIPRSQVKKSKKN